MGAAEIEIALDSAIVIGILLVKRIPKIRKKERRKKK
jgi:hypothetical protein